jgi:hypothetical protein
MIDELLSILPLSMSLEIARDASLNPWAMHFVSANVSNDSNSILRMWHSLIASLNLTFTLRLFIADFNFSIDKLLYLLQTEKIYAIAKN